ncbi:hypothetical protein BIFGAL_04407 [Bifidobacterium gallicum DSM 20093 = LMG 11596]|uniref:Uncharacterized protein n=1 Tax=Bifidobacterium gallicum DSM 20093 = LMG 11596 TaxID=561180 RepID=D1NWZ9_9BIFI|nr:hypothetical protein BIFGAL_04407 [Bifidobacterium gallicum DSM 20093 = LMG 11596]
MARLEAFLAGVRTLARALCEGRKHGLRIAVGQMPGMAEFALVNPKLGMALDSTLLSCLQGRDLVVIHDLVGGLATLGHKVIHAAILAQGCYVYC